jgi:DNA polymerase-3 subunit delta
VSGVVLFYILYGEDDFSLKEALTDIKKGLGDEAMVATNTTVLQGQSISPEQLTATCDTIPFLAPKRLVIVEGLLGLFEQQGRGKRPSLAKNSGWASIGEYIKRMPDSTVLVLIDSKIERNNPLLKELSKQADAREFKPLSGDQLHNWIRIRVKKYGGSISPAAVQLLANLVGGNLWLLSNEIDKLCLFTMGKTIDKDDIKSLVTEARQYTIFAMVDAILERRSSAATKLLHRLEDEGEAPPYLLFMITRQFRLVIQAKDLLQQRRKAADIKLALGIGHDFILRKTTEQARTHSMERLRGIYRKLLDTDISIKTGRFRGDKGELALDLLINELCGEPV